MKPGIEGSWLARVNADAPKSRRKNPKRETASRRILCGLTVSENDLDEEKRLTYAENPSIVGFVGFLEKGVIWPSSESAAVAGDHPDLRLSRPSPRPSRHSHPRAGGQRLLGVPLPARR